jgi:indoleamine 2,3-dioxygenase
LATKAVSLAEFGLSPEWGYMQHQDPIKSLSPGNEAWDEMARNLPKYLMASNFRKRVEELPPFQVSSLNAEGEIRRAMLALSYIGMAYQWSEEVAAQTIPSVLAKPWYEVGKLVGRPPILSYASYSIDNWYRLRATDGVECGNIALLQCFLGGQDEEWFIIIHIDIEKKAGAALHAIELAQKAVVANDADALDIALTQLRDGIKSMYDVLARMPEKCDPYVYFHRVRPYIFGWRNNPALPNGVVYEGVSDLGGKGMKYRGETGAQSAIVPALDGVLGIEHERDELREYLMEMREYMPPQHVKFIEAVENGPSVRDFVTKVARANTSELFNQSVELLGDFRAMHLEYAGQYIHAQAQKAPGNPSAVGTGGTPFMVYLRKHRDETRAQTVTK